MNAPYYGWAAFAGRRAVREVDMQLSAPSIAALSLQHGDEASRHALHVHGLP